MLKYHVFELAKAKGYSKTQLKEKAKMSSTTLAKLGKNEPVSLDVILRICDILNCQPGDLIFYEPEIKNVVHQRLLEEMQMDLRGGIYHHTQILLAYNSNHIEGSRLTEEQTRYIFETNTIGVEKDYESINVDDVIETINHFEAFRYVIQNAMSPLSEGMIKELHKILKSNTLDSKKEWFRVGDYKLRPNMIGENTKTSAPKDVEHNIQKLLNEYQNIREKKEGDIIDFHYRFEKIHPFQDGNGRVGRLILFKECLYANLLPIVILDSFKNYYYRGLKEYKNDKAYLIDTCLHGQDMYKALLKDLEVI